MNTTSETNTTPPFTDSNSTIFSYQYTIDECTYVEYVDSFIVNYMVIPAIGVTILLSFLKRRKKLFPNVLWGRPHLVYPVNFIDDYGHRFAYASVFVLITYKVLLLFGGYYYWKPSKFDDSEWMKTYGWTKVFVALINTAMMVIVYYPFFVCISLRQMIFANIMGLIYVCPWLWYFVEIWRWCPAWKDAQEEEDAAIVTSKLVPDLPIIIAFLTLILTYFYDLGRNIYRIYIKKNQFEKYQGILKNRHMRDPHPVLYTKELMRKRPKKDPSNLKEKIKHQVTYEKIEGFHYSTRVICTMIVAGVGILKLSMQGVIEVESLYPLVVDTFYELQPLLEALNPNISEEAEFYMEYVKCARGSMYFGIWMSFVLHVLFMIHMVIMYRKHLNLYYEGDRSWHFERNNSSTSIMVASLRYSGYQIAYILYGFIILTILLTLVAFAFGILICLPIKYRYINFVIAFLITYWPTIVVTIVIILSQTIVARLFLLQGYGKYLALNNRRFYHILTLFVFFYNFLIGLFSCLRRIVFSLVFGVLLVSRLDRCLLMRGFERFDSGHGAYLSMLEVEVAHNNPVMKTFIHLLWNSIENKDEENKASNTNIENQEKVDNKECIAANKITFLDKEKEFIEMNKTTVTVENGDVNISIPELPKKQKRSKRWRNKWFKAWTLINNPTLHLDLLKEEMNAAAKNKHQVKDKVIETAGTVVTGFVGGTVLSAAVK